MNTIVIKKLSRGLFRQISKLLQKICLKSDFVIAIHEERIEFFAGRKFLFVFWKHIPTKIFSGAFTSQMLGIFD